MSPKITEPDLIFILIVSLFLEEMCPTILPKKESPILNPFDGTDKVPTPVPTRLLSVVVFVTVALLLVCENNPYTKGYGKDGEVPLVPAVPATPAVPELAEVPDEPLVPEAPEVPADPDVPATPEVPDSPLVPAEPEVPAVPFPPAAPLRLTVQSLKVPVPVVSEGAPNTKIPVPESYDVTIDT